ncbi:hypothetical protein ACFX13_019190 [Malus domestica]
MEALLFESMLGKFIFAKYFRWLCLHTIFVLLLFSKPQLVSCSAIIKTLPGFHGSLSFKLEIGYIGVDEKEDEYLFYYLIEPKGTQEMILFFSGLLVVLLALVYADLCLR